MEGTEEVPSIFIAPEIDHPVYSPFACLNATALSALPASKSSVWVIVFEKELAHTERCPEVIIRAEG